MRLIPHRYADFATMSLASGLPETPSGRTCSPENFVKFFVWRSLRHGKHQIPSADKAAFPRLADSPENLFAVAARLYCVDPTLNARSSSATRPLIFMSSQAIEETRQPFETFISEISSSK